MEITPHKGVGNIKFGMLEKEVIAELGKPSERESSSFEEDDSESVNLEYESLGLQLNFSSEDNFRLGTITCTLEEHTLFGHSFIGQEEAFLNQESVKSSLIDLKLDDDLNEPGSTDFYSDKHGISLWIHEGIIMSLSMFPEYDTTGDSVIWPQ